MTGLVGVLYSSATLQNSIPFPERTMSMAFDILNDLVEELKQYPTLRVEVGNARFESLDRMKEESKEATMQLVEMECGYLTVEERQQLIHPSGY